MFFFFRGCYSRSRYAYLQSTEVGTGTGTWVAGGSVDGGEWVANKLFNSAGDAMQRANILFMLIADDNIAAVCLVSTTRAALFF